MNRRIKNIISFYYIYIYNFNNLISAKELCTSSPSFLLGMRALCERGKRRSQLLLLLLSAAGFQ